MNFCVEITREAQKDLIDIWKYVDSTDVDGKADDLLDRLEQTCGTLSYSPDKGHIPPELSRIAIDTYKEIHYRPYRIIYEIVDRYVYVHAVLDGRRDLQSLLERRLLR